MNVLRHGVVTSLPSESDSHSRFLHFWRKLCHRRETSSDLVTTPETKAALAALIGERRCGRRRLGPRNWRKLLELIGVTFKIRGGALDFPPQSVSVDGSVLFWKEKWKGSCACACSRKSQRGDALLYLRAAARAEETESAEDPEGEHQPSSSQHQLVSKTFIIFF